MKNLTLYFTLLVSSLFCFGQEYKTLKIDEEDIIFTTDGDSILISNITKQKLHGTYYDEYQENYVYYKNGKNCILKDLIHFEKETYQNHTFFHYSIRPYPNEHFETINSSNKNTGLHISVKEQKGKRALELNFQLDKKNRTRINSLYNSELSEKEFFPNNVIKEETFSGMSQKDSLYSDNSVENRLSPEIRTIISYNKKAQFKEIVTYLIEFNYEAGKLGQTYMYPDSKNHYIIHEYISTSEKHKNLEDNPKHLMHVKFDNNGNMTKINFYDQGALLGSIKFNKNGIIILPFE